MGVVASRKKSFHWLSFRNKELSGTSYMCLFLLPITLNTIHVVIGSILFFPSQEKLLLMKEEFGEYLLEKNTSGISAGLIGVSVCY